MSGTRTRSQAPAPPATKKASPLTKAPEAALEPPAPPAQTPAPVSQPPTPIVNIDTEPFKQILANASVADTKHDFHKNFHGIRKWLEQANITREYNNGLPSPGFNAVTDEENVLASVIESVANYNPVHNLDPTIVTVTGLTYNVKRTVVRPPKVKSTIKKLFKKLIPGRKEPVDHSREYIGAKQFTTELDIENHSAFIIDFAAVSIDEILTSSSAQEFESGAQKTISYVFDSEVENDPAPKTRTDNPMFKRVGAAKTGHNLVSCSPMDLTGKNNYYYQWLGETTSAYNYFYSKYKFQLSSLNEIKKGKSLSYTTNLRITDTTGKFDTKPIMDSKLANSITSISSLIKSVQAFFSKSSQPAAKISENTFTMNASFQQKRSGDWLQVLLCLLVLQRRYKNSNVQTSENKDIQKLFDEIYFVTHDRIAMAFALLLGINVIFTHGDSQQAFSFKIQNAQQKTERINAKFDEISGAVVTRNELELMKMQYINYNNAYKNTIYDVFVPQCTDTKEIFQQCDELITAIETANEMPETKTYNSLNFLNATRQIFKRAFQHCYFKLIFPNISEFDTEIKSIDVDAFKAQIIAANTEVQKQTCIDEYNKYMGYFKTCENTLSMYLNPPVTTQKHSQMKGITTAPEVVHTMNPKFQMNDILNKLRKEPNYKAADVWTWDIPQGPRYYERILEIVTASDYRNDKNLFLYNLNNLDPDCKQKICETYAYFYEAIPSITDIKANSTGSANVNRQKFTNISQAFCVEVLLNLAMNPVLPNGNADTIIEGFIKKRVAGKSFFDKIGKFDANLNYHPIISDVNVIQENAIIIQQSETIISSVNAKNITPGETALQSGGDKYLIDFTPIVRTSFEYDQGSRANVFIEETPKEAIKALLNMHLGYNTADSIAAFSIPATELELQRQLTDIYLEQAETEQEAPGHQLSPALAAHLVPNAFNLHTLALNPRLGGEDLETWNSLTPEERATLATEQDEGTGLHAAIAEAKASVPEAEKRREILESADPTLLPQAGGSSEKDLSEGENEGEELNQDILTDNSICFHPSFPIYIMADAYVYLVENDDIEESLEYDFCIKYFNFLKKCQERLALSYANENNTTDNKIKAYIIGMGLKQLFFTANVDKDGFQKCFEALGMTEREYMPICSLSGTLSYTSSGNMSQTDKERLIGMRILESPIFADYMATVNPKQIFDEPLKDFDWVTSSFLLGRSKRFLIETGQKIIADRTGQSSAPPEASGEGIGAIPAETPAVLAENDQAQGVAPQKSFDYRRLDQGPIDEFAKVRNFGTPISVGGKKKRSKVNRVKRANKTNKKNRNKKGGKRTIKHRKVHKKKYTRKHKK